MPRRSWHGRLGAGTARLARSTDRHHEAAALTAAVILTLLILSALGASKCAAATLTVSPSGAGQFAAIQAALDAAAPRDTLLLLPGTFTQYSQRLADGVVRRAVGWIEKPVTIVGTEGSAIRGPTERDSWAFFSEIPDTIRFSGVTIRDMDSAIRADGITQVDSCQFLRLTFGLLLSGPEAGMSVKSSTFERMFDVGVWCTQGAKATVADCRFSGDLGNVGSVAVVANNGGHVDVSTCQFESIQLMQAQFSTGTIHACDAANLRAGGLASVGDGAIVHASRITMDGTNEPGRFPQGIAAWDRGQILADSLILRNCWAPVRAFDSGFARVRASHLVSWKAYAVYLSSYQLPPAVTLDLAGNYWGPVDSAAVATAIRDGHDGYSDLPYGFVDFWPMLSEPVSGQKTSIGSFKAMYRGSKEGDP